MVVIVSMGENASWTNLEKKKKKIEWKAEGHASLALPAVQRHQGTSCVSFWCSSYYALIFKYNITFSKF